MNESRELPIATKPAAVYVHIPFCHHHCGYCNFTLISGRDDLVDSYLDALTLDISSLQIPRSVQTIFIGGGTPSLLNAKQTIRLMELLEEWFPLRNVLEYSIEVNPNDVTSEKLALWREGGINRVSVGGQSFQHDKLVKLERTHSPEQLRESVSMLKESFPRVALDLIFGVPGETISHWELDLESAVDLGISHLSTYGLTFEKGSRFWGLRERGLLHAVDEDLELKMYQLARQKLLGAGYDHYEVSNFAKDSDRCLHNETYWNGGGYYAFGAGAAYYVEACRGVKHRSTTTYIKKIKRGESPVAEEEVLSAEQCIRERFVFGMRKLEGVRLESLGLERYPELRETIVKQMDRHIAEGWMQVVHDRVSLTEAGLWISDSLWGDYL